MKKIIRIIALIILTLAVKSGSKSLAVRRISEGHIDGILRITGEESVGAEVVSKYQLRFAQQLFFDGMQKSDAHELSPPCG